MHNKIIIDDFGLNKQVLFEQIEGLRYKVRFGTMRYGRQTIRQAFITSPGSAPTAEDVVFTLNARSSLKEFTKDWMAGRNLSEADQTEIMAFLQGDFETTINWNQFLVILEESGITTARDRFAFITQLLTEAHEGKHLFIFVEDFKPLMMKELNALKQSGHNIDKIIEYANKILPKGTYQVRAEILAKIIELKRGITLTPERFEEIVKNLTLICHHAEEKAAIQTEAKLLKNLIEADDGLTHKLFTMESGYVRRDVQGLSTVPDTLKIVEDTELLYDLTEAAQSTSFDDLFLNSIGRGQIPTDIGIFFGAVDVDAMPNIYQNILDNFPLK